MWTLFVTVARQAVEPPISSIRRSVATTGCSRGSAVRRARRAPFLRQRHRAPLTSRPPGPRHGSQAGPSPKLARMHRLPASCAAQNCPRPRSATLARPLPLLYRAQALLSRSPTATLGGLPRWAIANGPRREGVPMNHRVNTIACALLLSALVVPASRPASSARRASVTTSSLRRSRTPSEGSAAKAAPSARSSPARTPSRASASRAADSRRSGKPRGCGRGRSNRRNPCQPMTCSARAVGRPLARVRVAAMWERTSKRPPYSATSSIARAGLGLVGPWRRGAQRSPRSRSRPGLCLSSSR